MAEPATHPAPSEQLSVRWSIREPSSDSGERDLALQLGLDPLVASILVARGLDTPAAAEAFLRPALTSLHDPFLMADMDRAVERVTLALERGEAIAVYGDYDVDGVTSTACLVSFLRACGGSVVPYIPRRLEEGYGLNVDAMEALASEGAGLIVCCDCGVDAVTEVERAARLGVDVVIVDHHRVPASRPRAVALLDPHRPDCGYPYRDLAAVGVTFKLLMALRKRLRDAGFFSGRTIPEPNLREYLDLVALGTVADVVPLTGENRILVAHGLQVLAEGRRVGLRALNAVSGVDLGSMSAGQIGFRLGPRINAAGRMDDARAGLELLLTTDPHRASQLADSLDQVNADRRRIEQQVLLEALTQAESRPTTARGLVLWGDGWHPGVVGIVASRVVERYHRPALVLGREGDDLQGSGRSIPGFNLHEALVRCRDHLERFGGHAAAAGLRLPAARAQEFSDAFLSVCDASLQPSDLVPVLRVDAKLDPARVDGALVAALEALAPFGAGNPKPVFAWRGAALSSPALVGRPGADGARHLKARIAGHDAIGFGLGSALSGAAARFDVAYSIGYNHWGGRRTLQLALKGLTSEGTSSIDWSG